jgi:hypothetical protein
MIVRGKSRAARMPSVSRLLSRAAAAAVEPLEPRELLSGTTSTGGPIVAPAHVVIVIEEDRYANAIGDTANMPYLNQLAGTGLVYSNSHGLNTSSQAGEMSYLGLFSGSTQGVTDDAYHGPFSGGNLSQSLNNAAGLSFASYAESMPRAGDTTDNYAADPNNPAYDDLYMRAYNPASQFTNLGTGKTSAQVNLTFASFPTTSAGYASLPPVSFVIPNTLHNTHGSNDTNPYATDPSQYNYLRQNADTWLRQNLDGYLQWAKQNNSLLIITGDEGDRAHNFAAGFATIINGSSNLFVAGTDTKSVTPYNLLRTVEDMYSLAPLANSASAADYDTDTTGRLAPTSSGVTRTATTTALSSSLNPATAGQSVTFTATVTSASGTPGGTVSFLDGSTTLGTGTLNASDVATFTTSSLVAGTHSITAAYAGSSTFATSTSSALSETINPASNAPANDNFANATVLSGSSVTITGTNANATKEAGEPNHGGNTGGKSVWYRWTAPSSGTVTIDTHGSSFDTLLGAYTGTSVSALTTVASDDDDPAGGTTTSKVTFAATAGTTYMIAVDGYGGVAGSITLNVSLTAGALMPPTGVSASDGAYTDGVHLSWNAVSGATAYAVWRYTTNDSTKATQVNTASITGTTFIDNTATPGATYYYWVTAKNASSISAFSAADTGYRAAVGPLNNNFANRITITGTSVTTTGSNVGASKETGEPSTVAGNAGGRSVWWTWTAPTSGKVTIDTHGSTFDTLLGVYSGSSLGSLTVVAANDDDPAGGTTTSKVVFNAVAGTTYQILVDGYGGATGNITLNLSLS